MTEWWEKCSVRCFCSVCMKNEGTAFLANHLKSGQLQFLAPGYRVPKCLSVWLMRLCLKKWSITPELWRLVYLCTLFIALKGTPLMRVGRELSSHHGKMILKMDIFPSITTLLLIAVWAGPAHFFPILWRPFTWMPASLTVGFAVSMHIKEVLPLNWTFPRNLWEDAAY